MKERERKRRWTLIFTAAVLLTGTFLGLLKEDTAQASQMETETVSSGNLKREVIFEPTELAQLQIPQRMEIVIDPWEIDGKEQIYSEEYTVQNTGEAPGILTLDFTCKVGAETGLSFQEDPDGLRDSGEKRLHMKVLFGTGEEAVFTLEGTRYQVELQPGETLILKFTGEVNENAKDPWKDGDLEIEGMYSWEGEMARADKILEEIPKAKKETFGANISSADTGEDAGESPVLPDETESGGNGEKPVVPGRTDEESAKDNSLSGNGLKE